MDMVVNCDRFPQPGETILASDFAMFPGGKGANQAVACAKLGGRVEFVARMGRDMFRDRLMASLEQDGVGIDHLQTDQAASTGIAMITVDCDGQNEIVVVSGSNMTLTPEDLENESGLFDGAAVVLLQLEIPIETVQKAAEMGRAAGATVVINPAPAHHLPPELLQCADFLTPNETEATALTGIDVHDVESAGEAAHALIEKGVGAVIVTLGEQGALLVTRDESRHFIGLPARVVDTTGAGDAFNGALAFALATGRTVYEAISLANAVAAYSVTRPGAQASMPTTGDVTSFSDNEDGEMTQVGAEKEA